MGERPTPDAPHPGKRRPPRAPSSCPPSTQERAVGLGTGSHARTPPHPQLVGSGPRQPAQRAGSRGWESALPLSDIHTLDTKIWTHVATQGKLSLRTPNKTKYSPRHTLVLDITKPSDRTHTLTINLTTRYLRSKGPYLANTLFLNVLTHHNQRANLIQTITSASSYYLNLTCHNVPNCNPTDFHKVLWFRAGAAQQVHESQSTAVRECI